MRVENLHTKKQRMYALIEDHGKNLKRIFKITGIDPVRLSKMVMLRETVAHRLATDYCNGENGVTTENWEGKSDKVLDSLNRVLHFRELKIPVFVNGDARGYALKIDDEYVRSHDLKIHKDWGGYGILAPDFREGN